MVNAGIEIIDGKIRVNFMNASGKEVTNPCYQLMHLKTILDDTLFNFEKEFQKQYIPDENTVYNLPKDV